MRTRPRQQVIRPAANTHIEELRNRSHTYIRLGRILKVTGLLFGCAIAIAALACNIVFLLYASIAIMLWSMSISFFYKRHARYLYQHAEQLQARHENQTSTLHPTPSTQPAPTHRTPTPAPPAFSARLKKILYNGTIPYAYQDSITYDVMDNPVINPCGHSFDQASIAKWQQTQRPCLCPLCRTPIAKKLVPNRNLKETIDQWVKRQEKKASRVPEPKALPQHSTPRLFARLPPRNESVCHHQLTRRYTI